MTRNTSELIRSENESVFVVRVDHGQVIAECINAGEEFSPSGTAVEMFKDCLIKAGQEEISSPDRRCARHETPDDCAFFGCGARRTPPPMRAEMAQLEARLTTIEAACAGIVRDHEIRRAIAAGKDPSIARIIAAGA